MANILELIVRGRADQLDSVIRSSGKNIETFGRKSIAAFRRVGRTINTVSDRYLTRFNGLIGGAALLYAGKGVIDLDSRLARLAITAGKGAGMLVGLKKELFAISTQTYTPVGDLVDYINVIVAKTGDLDFAMKTLKEAGTVSASTGTTMENLGAVAANLSEKLKIKPGDYLKAMDILNLGAKAGAIEFKDFAAQMEVIASATGRFNLEGLKGVRTLSAWVQVSKKSNASADETATAIKGSISEMLTAEKIKQMQKLGFNPIDVVASKKAGVTVMKDIEDVIKGIVKATKGDEIKLGEIFGLRSITAFTDIAREFRATGRFDTFDKFAQQGGDGVETMKDFHFWSKQTAAQITNMKTELSKFTNENLAGPIELLNKALTFLNNHPIITKGGLRTALGIGGLLVGSKIIRGISEAFGMFTGRGGKGLPGIAGGLGGLTGGKGPIPVYIVNAPGLMQNPMSGYPGTGTTGVPGGGKFGKVARQAGAAIGTGIAAFTITSAILNATGLDKKIEKGGGSLYGAMDKYLGNGIMNFIDKKIFGVDIGARGKPEVKNKIDITLTDNRTIVKADNMNTDAKITVPRTKH
ncbi:MAG: phage tail tape measure protein [Deltaproteobacteria bacterium CG1_02_45_11]|nr:MAG: phage tail tape measure protein [Deltaproteobacteria bacterium CG1_02_45_11]